MVTRRDVLALAGAAPALLLGTKADAQPQGQSEPEQHEFVQGISSFEKRSFGVVFHCTTSQKKNVDVTLTVCTSEILRVQMCPDPELKSVKGLLEIKEDWSASPFGVTEKPEAVSIDTGSLRIEFQKKPWKYAIYDKQGQVVLEEKVRDRDVSGNFRSLPLGFTTVAGKCNRTNETFNLPEDENIYGFGERFSRLNKVGLRVNGWLVDALGDGTNEVYKEIPFFMSTGGYGIFANTTFRSRWDMGNLSMFSYSFLIDDPRLDYFVIYGPTLKQVLARYEEITGWPAFPPKKSFGVWFKTHGSDTGDTGPMALAKKFRELHLPVDFFTHVVSVRPASMAAELALARKLSAELAKLGIVIGMYASPRMEPDWEIAKEALARGFVLTQSDGTPYMSNMGGGPGSNKVEESIAAIERDEAWRDRYYKINRAVFLLPDFTNPVVVKWWKDIIADLVKAGCFGSGMSDFGEDVPPDAHYYNKRSGLEMHNFYTMLYQKYTFEAIAENSPDHRPLINARSGTTGLQRYPICWSGDPNSEWEDMASVLRSGLSIGLSGVPFWSNDIAGYSNTPGLSAELYIRWMQMAMFQSHVRFNGTPQRNPWTFGDRAVENYRKYANLRYRLLPYIYSHAYNATKTGLPMIRAMVLEFQDDPGTHNLQDQYMFGDAFLVAPIFKPVSPRIVYLPAGTWYDYETGTEFKGPGPIRIEPSLDVLPVFVRDNSIVPMGPEMAYIGEKPFDPITLDIRISYKTECILYDDDERARTQEIVQCRASKRANQIHLNVGASTKTFIAKFNKTSRPKRVSLNGKDLQHVESLQAIEKAEEGWYFAPSSVVYAKFSSHETAKDLVLQL